jgi:hypothetical protein
LRGEGALSCKHPTYELDKIHRELIILHQLTIDGMYYIPAADLQIICAL